MTPDATETTKQTDLPKLKVIVAAFKKKYENALSDLTLKEKQIRSLLEDAHAQAMLEEENQALISQLSMLKARLEQRQQEANSHLENERKEWHGKLSHADAEIQRLQQEIEHLHTQLEKQHDEPRLFNTDVQHKLEIQRLLAKIDDIDALRATFEKQSLDLIHQVHALEAAQEDAKHDKRLTAEQHDQLLQAERTKCMALEQRVHSLTLAMESLEALKTSLAEEEKYCSQLKNELLELQEQAERDKQRIEKLATQLMEKDKRIQDLQRLEASVKKSAEQKQELEETKEEKKLLEEQLAESRKHAEQLERVIQFLRERSEEAHLEVDQLREEYQKSHDTIRDLQLKQEAISAEIIASTQQLQNEQKEKQETMEEMSLLQGQFQELKNRYAMLQKELENSQTELEIANKHTAHLDAHQRELIKHLDDQGLHIESFEKESGLIKQTLIRGLREAQEIQNLYQASVEDKVSTAAKLCQAHQQLERYRDQLKLLQGQLDGALDNALMLTQLLEQTQRDNEEQDKLCQQINGLKRERETLQSEVMRLQGLVQEKDGEVSQVQHHFAKKLKEASSFEDKCEEQSRLISEQQQTLYQNKIKIAELQASVDMQAQQQKLFQDQLQEAIKSSEVQLGKWEEKYFVLYDKWQAAESRVKELEKIEEKQKHLQGMLANLGSFLGNL